ncbi:1,4-dihydroxy-2-naphthoate octaprenyltransferase [Terasakiella brassicae]|uniref:1,4-dihydroxy-2-naphthoate octaprenyltransferase n=1 Tax=Terasakiella brassicae TaxID=1634917 RepID=A0A917C2J0_9PROT|nr:1,4-dihydroxy-2-naphthoate octaprenyltransferase [Terasakiella brassicae]GGF67709.1 1,4-dihydroxy-2-naphthoate octaprenyltransferase [Terasakiella brassicae]
MLLPRFSVLWVGIRPKTLSMSLTPILVAFSLALHNQQPPNYLVLLAICIGAISIQIATNLFNDAQDFLNGTDTGTRIGPQRITQAGLATPSQTRYSAFLFIAIAAFCGLYLISIGGWIIMLCGGLALLCAYIYSNGPFPISRGPFGEVFVMLFFGIAAFNVSYFLLANHWPANGLIYGIAIGCPACAILLLNNYRDLENDTLAGRKTLAIYLGSKASKVVFALLMLAPYVLLLTLPVPLWFFAGIPLAILATFKIFTITHKVELNANLGISAASQILLCIGLAISLM